MSPIRVVWKVLVAGAAALVLSGCTVPVVTPQVGPLYISGNYNVVVGVAVAGRRAGGPCLREPVCLIPQQ